ncbi:MAG: MoaF N-terminal domain-containing protein [Gammaproteobacteria bacterium]|nr:MoaF N-terminal domain-containing protein [Gammaproteobacteria bacterium]
MQPRLIPAAFSRAVLSAPALLAMAVLASVPVRAADIASDDSHAPAAEIGGPSTREMAGLTLHYVYSGGRDYQLSFDADTVTFLPFRIPGDPPGTQYQPGTLKYRARLVRPGLYLVHWLVRPPQGSPIHVTLLVDLQERHVHVSALMPGGMEFFDIAEIKTITWKKPPR